MLIEKLKNCKNVLKDFAVYLKANEVPIDKFFTKVGIDKQYQVICNYISSVLWYRLVIKDNIIYLIKDDPVWESSIVFSNRCYDKEFALKCAFEYFEQHDISAYGKCPF